MTVRDCVLIVAIGGLLVPACTPSSSESSGPGSSNTTDDGGGGGNGGGGGGGGDGAGAGGAALPDGTLLYVRHETKDHDAIVARDLASGDERVVTDLTGDGSSGWEIWGYSLSPDRRRIAIASLYGPTKEDTDTGLATRAIWTLSTDGTDFRRLTPTFKNTGQGKQSFSISVSDPEWTADGSNAIYNYGEYWYEGTTLKGGSFPWTISAAGGAFPASFVTPTDCGQILHPSRNPVTGEFVFVVNICIPGQGDGAGLYLYPPGGSRSPTKLVASSRVDGGIDVYSAKVAWLSDGSGFLFLGGTSDTNWSPSLLAYDMKSGDVSMLVVPPEGSTIDAVAISPDASKIVYCLRNSDDSTTNLHLIASKTDTAITTDGKSCDPSF